MNATNVDPLWDLVGIETRPDPEPVPCCRTASAAPEYHDEVGCDFVGRSSDPGEFYDLPKDRRTR